MGKRAAVTLFVCALVATLAPASHATHSNKLHTWKGRVTHIADGDTFDVDLFGDGTSKVQRVRVSGIQTMEIGECHAKAATRSLARMIGGKVVRLSAVDPRSRALDPNRARSRQRLLRYVEVRRNGKWMDVSLEQLRRGHALWLPHNVENANHSQYHLAAVQASLTGKNLWNPHKCKRGPYPKLPLTMWVQSDAEGNDFDNVNGEWIKLRNTSSTVTLKLGGWRLRDAAQRGYRIPKGTKVPPGKTLTIRVGKGRDKPLKKFWGRSKPLFRNVYEATDYTGDGMYLFDRHLDHRAWFVYPCLQQAAGCLDPLLGKVRISNVNWDAPGGQPEPPGGEWIDITNVSAERINLYGYLIDSQPYSYAFKPGTLLDPGQTLQLVVGRGRDTALRKYWGKNFAILTNAGDSVALRTFDYILLDCHAWGTGSCNPYRRLLR